MAADEENPETTDPPQDADSAPEASTAGEHAGHAVPTEDAEEIASEVEDAPLEALQEAQEAAAADAEPPADRPAPAEQPAPADEPAPAEPPPPAAAEQAPPAADDTGGERAEDEGEATPRVKPSVPGAHLEVDIVPEGVDPLGREEGYEDPYAVEEEAEAEPAAEGEEEREEPLAEPIATAAIDLASGARYRATGKRKTAIARVTLRPGTGSYLINGRSLEVHFPRETLQRNIRQPLETVGYQERMDVVARLHGGGISAQAGALRHGVSRALLEADPNLRGELKRRGFLTRDSRAKERKKAGLKKARKRPQFSKR
jgi:small subunit ribosomal protein S9